ncbi:MAG: hypothetical protein ACRD0W_00915 [Acidimicrobiales bacterium]
MSRRSPGWAGGYDIHWLYDPRHDDREPPVAVVVRPDFASAVATADRCAAQSRLRMQVFRLYDRWMFMPVPPDSRLTERTVR